LPQPTYDFISDPTIFNIGQLPSRAFRKSEKQGGEKIDKLSLNGEWSFFFTENKVEIPAGFEKPDFDYKDWGSITVPANWEFKGYGTPIHVNDRYLFPQNPPFVPEQNPCGIYKKKVDIPSEWKDKHITLTIGAVKSAAYIYINGEFVAYNQDSRTEVRIDVTDYFGESIEITIQVFTWCDGSYLECHDLWRVSGIEREVYLTAKEYDQIYDFAVHGLLQNNYIDRVLNIKTALLLDGNETYQIKYELTSLLGVKEVEHVSEVDDYYTMISFDIPNVEPWCGEEPHLYELKITLLRSGQVMDVVQHLIGFRNIEILDHQLCINGQPLIMNTHDKHKQGPVSCQMITIESMIDELELLKEQGCNTVRSSHYHNAQEWYELCDEYGMYVIDEANIERHDMAPETESLAKNKNWQAAQVDRIQRMYLRSKNHTCIIAWSLSNEGNDGVGFEEGYQWLKTQDPTRIIL